MDRKRVTAPACNMGALDATGLFLIESGLMEIVTVDGEECLRVTPRGRAVVRAIESEGSNGAVN